MLHRLWASVELPGEQPRVSLLPLLFLVVPPGGQALHRVGLHIQDALELLGLPLIRQGDGLLREHCREGMGYRRGQLRTLPGPP